MCDKDDKLECLHYTLEVGGNKTRVYDVCGSEDLCGDSVDYEGSEVEIECGAIKNVMGMIASFVALYLAMWWINIISSNKDIKYKK